MIPVTKEIEVEVLISLYPKALSNLITKGICGLRCGEKIKGTLEEAAKEKGFSDSEIEKIVDELNTTLNNSVLKAVC